MQRPFKFLYMLEADNNVDGAGDGKHMKWTGRRMDDMDEDAIHLCISQCQNNETTIG